MCRCSCRQTAVAGRFATLAEAARYFGVSRSTIHRLCRDGELPIIKLRGAIRVDLVAAEAALISRGVGTPKRSIVVETE